MKQNEIIEMAKNCGLLDMNYEIGQWDIHEVTSFAKLVAAKEREACAQICENFDPQVFSVAAAIRARGEA